MNYCFLVFLVYLVFAVNGEDIWKVNKKCTSGGKNQDRKLDQIIQKGQQVKIQNICKLIRDKPHTNQEKEKCMKFCKKVCKGYRGACDGNICYCSRPSNLGPDWKVSKECKDPNNKDSRPTEIVPYRQQLAIPNICKLKNSETNEDSKCKKHCKEKCRGGNDAGCDGNFCYCRPKNK
uniref:Salivary antigen 1 n=1 Tax=Ctenocephalides felis TaxID=7515 RepID=CTF1_CTEFE|nr:RecName: Full=Salivary antigen 1; AltName: Full=FS-I; AltName: Allergen=Cte f 1; Flags: Precursor [Ctenocephalides felis]AAD17905.1 salivary antigen 1 precursor [Ctenocephalides felis]